ncbi:MAG: hypothetical protein IT437_02275 [Phycisphaerales bacterium]|nr:hypothetical protein [Phycisphaerales bacterium]
MNGRLLLAMVAAGGVVLGGVARGQVVGDQPAAAPVADGPVAEFLRAGAVRYWPSRAAADRAKPSLLLQGPFMVMEGVPDAPWAKPAFAEVEGRHTASIPLDAGAVVLAPGIVNGPIRKGAAVTANSDTGGLPWIMVVRPGSSVASFLVDTTAPCEIRVGDAVEISSGAEFPVLETLSVDAVAAVGALATLTGWMDLPPLWGLGYQHGDTSLTSAESVLIAARRLRAERLPGDGVWVAGVGSPPAAFPDGVRAGLTKLGMQSLWTVPVVVDAAAKEPVWEGGSDDLLGGPEGPIRIGGGFAPDFTRATARRGWGAALEPLLAGGATGVEALSERVPRGVVFHADDDLGGTGDWDRYGAVYPTLTARAVREAFGRAQPNVRPFLTVPVLSPGVQRYASVWIPARGDDGGALAESLRRLQDASMSARFMAGMDIPGARRGGDGEGLARWFGVATLMPMLRGRPDAGHSCAPWDFGDGVSADVRAALERRARLTPYLYTLVFAAFRFDEPIVRPAWALDPADASLHDTPLVFLLGGEVLVDARQGGGALPARAGDWLPFDAQPGLPRLYLRPGAMIPMGPVRQFAGESPLDPLEFVIALDSEGKSAGMLYEDDGDGFGYARNQGRIAYYGAQRTDKDVVVKMARLDGGWAMAKRKFIARVLLSGGGEATGEFRDALDTHVTLP